MITTKEMIKIGYSEKWKEWVAHIDPKTCKRCRTKHGKIYEINEFVYPKPPLHNYCRCTIQKLKALLAGTATEMGTYGADWYLKHQGKLPDYYISRSDAKKQGWIPKKGNLADAAPNKMIFGGEYDNDDGKLPTKLGRAWYEADINYTKGRRNDERVLFSNDGLIFVTYNHYDTFMEIK